VKDHNESTFSLDININKRSSILLAPDSMTVIVTDPVLFYSCNRATAKFERIHFTDEAHIGKSLEAYSPDGKLFACRSLEDYDVRVWDTQTGQLSGKPIAMPVVHISPTLNDQSLGDQLIALHRRHTHTITLFEVHTGHLYAQFCDSGQDMTFIRDGTKLVSYSDPIRIHDIVDLAAKHWNATHGYEPVGD